MVVSTEALNINNNTNIAVSILALDKNAKVTVGENDVDQVVWLDGNPNNITREQILDKQAELLAKYNALAWKRNRQAEYPTIEELVVALYDSEDRAAIDTKRAEVKARYPKP